MQLAFSASLAGLAYGSLALAILGCIIFGLVHWNGQTGTSKGKEDGSGGSAAA